MKLSAASAFLVSAGPLVDLGRILAVITDRITDLPNRETGPLRRRLDSLVTVETGGAQGADDLPRVRTRSQAGAPAGWSITEDDPRMVVHPHPLVDVTLGKPRLVQAGACPAPLEAVHHGCVQPSGELARSDVGHCNAMYDTDQRGYPARRCLWLLQTRHSPTSQC